MDWDSWFYGFGVVASMAAVLGALWCVIYCIVTVFENDAAIKWHREETAELCEDIGDLDDRLSELERAQYRANSYSATPAPKPSKAKR